MADSFPKAGDRIRTDDNNVGNVVLYQLSYTRASGGQYRPADRKIAYPGL